MKRRTFLKGLLAVAGAATIAPETLLQYVPAPTLPAAVLGPPYGVIRVSNELLEDCHPQFVYDQVRRNLALAHQIRIDRLLLSEPDPDPYFLQDLSAIHWRVQPLA